MYYYLMTSNNNKSLIKGNKGNKGTNLGTNNTNLGTNNTNLYNTNLESNGSKFDKPIDNLIDLYFKQSLILYEHLFSSYHQFIEEIIPYCLKQEQNNFYENMDGNLIHFHGFKCDNIRIKPATFDNDNEIKFPNEARKNHLNYFASVIVDIKQYIETVNILTGDKTINEIHTENNIAVANIPIMLKSKYCSTFIKKDIHGECKYDPGGYFLVNGQEKIIMSIEKMAENKIFIFVKKDVAFDNGLSYTAHINSRKNDWSDNLQIATLKNRKDGVLSLSSSQLVDIPIFILLRALGLESDQEILSNICYNLSDIKMLNLLRPSMVFSEDEEGNTIKTKEEAINYLLNKLNRTKRISQTDEVLARKQKIMMLEKILKQDLLQHLGEDIPKKRVFICMMINKLLLVIMGKIDPDDRDALHNKRIETPGILLGQLFRQNWKKLLSEIGKGFRKKNQSDINPINVISQIKPTTIEQGIKTALATGVWGMNRTKNGVAHALQRVSWIKSQSYFRTVMAPKPDTATSGVTSIRHINNNQYKMLCPVETPEGANIGIVKTIAMMASITTQNNSQEKVLITILSDNKKIKHPADINPLEMNQHIKIFMNGNWYGVIKIKYSLEIYNLLKNNRKENIIDKYTSILFDFDKKEIRIYFDGGRLIRPLLIVNNNKLNLTEDIINSIYEEGNKIDINKSWKNIINKYKNIIEYEDIESSNFLMISERVAKLDEALDNLKRVVEYTETSKINRYGDYRYLNYTHCEFHGWVMLGTTAANIPFVNHDYATKSIVHFSQAKQTIGIYLTSFKDRMDISQILYHPQVPLAQTKAMKYNHFLDMPFGENAIIALMCYTGYNQEDSLVVNETAIERGLFRADSLKKYHSEIVKNPSTSQDDIFTKPDANKVTGMKQGNYSKLNDQGYVAEETEIFNNDIIIGKVSPIQPTGNNNKVSKDSSEQFKSNIPGVIDRVHTGIYNSEGYEMYNVRVRMERKPIIGDKFSNRHGQKGTLGIALPQRDMPFTEEGMIPDMIMNTHCIPSRMTVGQLVECIASKEAAINGHFVDGTPFSDYNVKEIPEILTKLGYSSYGTETMYNGLTGKKIEAKIFIGPTYQVRLNHMVQDKVHGRARGPRQALTRQPLEGRSRDGGLKIGEMEKDAIIAHGMGQFLKERMMETSDITKVYVCDDCGLFASKVIDKDYYNCKSCHNTTRISAVVIPYACKLLFQELMAVNILPRIRTEKTVYNYDA